MDDNNMYDNWSEIIAIMKTVINHGGSRAELRIAVESTLRTLGWRATTGSMKTDFTTKSGRKIDIVLGEKQPDNVFRAVLPIYADNEHPKGEDWSDFITEIMSDIDARIAIVAGSTFELFFMTMYHTKLLVSHRPLWSLVIKSGSSFLHYYPFLILTKRTWLTILTLCTKKTYLQRNWTQSFIRLLTTSRSRKMF